MRAPTWRSTNITRIADQNLLQAGTFARTLTAATWQAAEIEDGYPWKVAVVEVWK